MGETAAALVVVAWVRLDSSIRQAQQPCSSSVDKTSTTVQQQHTCNVPVNATLSVRGM